MNKLKFNFFSNQSKLQAFSFFKSKFTKFTTKLDLELKLKEKLKIEKLDVVDLSGDCGTSFLIKIKAEDFNGKTMIAQHRMINEILKDDLKGIHALQLKTEGTNK